MRFEAIAVAQEFSRSSIIRLVTAKGRCDLKRTEFTFGYDPVADRVLTLEILCESHSDHMKLLYY